MALSAECCCADCRKQVHYAECHNAECRYAECRGAVTPNFKEDFKIIVRKF
jgi:hypothetical protein